MEILLICGRARARPGFRPGPSSARGVSSARAERGASTMPSSQLRSTGHLLAEAQREVHSARAAPVDDQAIVAEREAHPLARVTEREPAVGPTAHAVVNLAARAHRHPVQPIVVAIPSE